MEGRRLIEFEAYIFFGNPLGTCYSNFETPNARKGAKVVKSRGIKDISERDTGSVKIPKWHVCVCARVS